MAERETAGKIDTCQKQKANSTAATTPNPLGGNTIATSGKTAPANATTKASTMTKATAATSPNPLGGNTTATSGNTTPAAATTTASGIVVFSSMEIKNTILT